MIELFEWSVVVDGQEIEVLAELRQIGDVIYLEDIAVYPASGASALRQFFEQFVGIFRTCSEAGELVAGHSGSADHRSQSRS